MNVLIRWYAWDKILKDPGRSWKSRRSSQFSPKLDQQAPLYSKGVSKKIEGWLIDYHEHTYYSYILKIEIELYIVIFIRYIMQHKQQNKERFSIWMFSNLPAGFNIYFHGKEERLLLQIIKLVWDGEEFVYVWKVRFKIVHSLLQLVRAECVRCPWLLA